MTHVNGHRKLDFFSIREVFIFVQCTPCLNCETPSSEGSRGLRRSADRFMCRCALAGSFDFCPPAPAVYPICRDWRPRAVCPRIGCLLR